jgi:NTP pyrophosphatase (non-canonical NTP hydrolase)
MKPKHYIQECLRVDTNKVNINKRINNNEHLQRLIHGAMGLSGESGEAIDLIKKTYIYGKELDYNKLKLELGDCLWYMSILLDEIGSSFEEVMQMNVDKLKTRYPEGFTEKSAIDRVDVKSNNE